MKNKFGKKPVSLILALSLALSNIGAAGAEEINTTPIQEEITAPAYEATSGAAVEYVSDDNIEAYGSETTDVNDVISLNRTAYVHSGESIDNVYLKIVPQEGINGYDTITLTLSSGTFDQAALESAAYTAWTGNDYDTMAELLDSGTSLTEVLNSNLGNGGLKLPYKYVSIGERELKIELFPIDKVDCGQSNNSVAYDIP